MSRLEHGRFILHTEGGTDTNNVPALNVETLTINQLYTELRDELQELDDSLDYFSVSTLIQYENKRRYEPIGRTRWIACYAVTGGSEGHYVHVDRIYEAKPYAREFTIEQLFLAKTFGGYERACEIAAYLGARLDA